MTWKRLAWLCQSLGLICEMCSSSAAPARSTPPPSPCSSASADKQDLIGQCSSLYEHGLWSEMWETIHNKMGLTACLAAARSGTGTSAVLGGSARAQCLCINNALKSTKSLPCIAIEY